MRSTAKETHRRKTTKKSAPAKRAIAPAKISVPRLTEVYRRERLFRMLDVAVRKRAVWLAAPAGAGKTSLVATYLEARGLPALWYNVDARDSDVANLFQYLAMAARLASKRRALELPVFSVEHQAEVAAFARAFFEALGAARPARSVIVIDDYQEARSELMDEVLREALFALPHGISTIIVSRTAAPAWMARHLASGDVASVGWEDLRLTAQEIVGLVRVYRPDLKGKQLQSVLPQISELANGWAAALALLLQIRHLDTIDALRVEEFSQRLFDYFATEILDKTTPVQREFLLKTSVVPRFTPELAARLTGHPDTGRLILELDRWSFLTQRLGTSGAYRYHPLLRGFLLRRAEATLGRTEVQSLHRLAAEAFVEMDLVDDAMEQFETSGDVEACVRLVKQVAGAYIGKGRGRTIEGWIQRFPEERIGQDGWLLHWAAASCLAYAPSRSRELFERAFAIFAGQSDAAGLYSCVAGAIHAICYEAMDYSRCDAWFDRFDTLRQKRLVCPDPLLPMVATGMLMASIFRRPDPVEGRAWADQAMALAGASGDVAHRVLTGGFLALRAVFHENIERADFFLQTLRESASASESALSVLTVLLSDATNAWARGENGKCIELARTAIAMAARTGVFVWNDQVCAAGVTSALTAEDFEAAREFLALLRSSAERGKTFSVGVYQTYAAWEALLAGDRGRALRLIDLAQEIADAHGFPLAWGITPFARAQILWIEGRKEEARVSLEKARAIADRWGYSIIRYGCDLVESDHEWDEDRAPAMARLASGFKLARERGYHNTFWLGRGTLTRSAVRALDHGIEPEYVRATIAKHGLVPIEMPLSPDGWPFRYRVRALGGFEVTSDDRANVGSALRGMPRRFFQAVVSFGGRGVRDTQIIDALWPDAEGDAGRRVFDTTLHRLRRQFGADDVLGLSDGRLSLNERLCWVDVWALERMLREAEREVTRNAPAATLARLAGEVLALYRGPLLPEDPFDWARGPRNRIAASFRRIAEQVAGALERGGLQSDANTLYQRVFQAGQTA